MTAVWKRTQGDAKDFLDARLDGVVDLAGVTSVLPKVWLDGQTPVALTGAVLDATERTVRVSLDPWLLTAEAKAWNLEIQCVWGSGETRTWPAPKERAFVQVRADA